MLFEIAGVRIGTSLSRDEVSGAPHLRPLLRFEGDGDPHLTIEVSLRPEPDIDTAFGARPTAERTGDELIFSRADFRARCHDDRPGRWTIEDTAGYGGVETLCRLTVGLALAQSGGALLHASGVATAAGAVVIAGPAGAGKSTAARNRPVEATVLSDEMVAIRRGGDGTLYACGTPFGGDLEPTASRERLHRLVFLRRGAPGNRLLQIGPAEYLREGLKAVFLCTPDPAPVEATLAFLQQLAEEVPVHWLEGERDGSFWPLLAGGKR